MKTGYVGAIVLLLFGVVILVTGITQSAGLPVYVLGGLLALSGILVFVTNKLKSKTKGDDSVEQK